jgi:hypothetical protein
MHLVREGSSESAVGSRKKLLLLSFSLLEQWLVYLRPTVLDRILGILEKSGDRFLWLWAAR